MPFIDQPEDEYQDSLTYREVPVDKNKRWMTDIW